MEAIVKLYSNTQNEIFNFLNSFFDSSYLKDSVPPTQTLEWQKKYQNPTEVVDIIGIFIENNDRFNINMWISLDPNFFINITDSNADQVIRYIYERYPW